MKKKHSILGIISLFMPPASLLLYLGQFWLFTSTSLGDKFTSLPDIEFVLALPVIGLLIAIFPLIREKRNPLFPIIGLAFNVVAILLEILFILMMIEIG